MVVSGGWLRSPSGAGVVVGRTAVGKRSGNRMTDQGKSVLAER